MRKTLLTVLPVFLLAISAPQSASATPLGGSAMKTADISSVENVTYYRRGYGYYGGGYGYYPRRSYNYYPRYYGSYGYYPQQYYGYYAQPYSNYGYYPSRRYYRW
jgi:hypothetical protein